MIYSETVHCDVICAIRPSCFFDIREAQCFRLQLHASRHFSKLPPVTAELYPEEI